MSTSEEILEVFNEDIKSKSKMVENKFGVLAFYDGCHDMRVFDLFGGLHIEEIVCADYKPKHD